jgi:hypothetical protein
MGLIREPKEIDFIINSKPWSDKELADFREIMKRKKKRLHNKTTKHYA